MAVYIFKVGLGMKRKLGIDADNDASGWQPGFGNAGQCS